MNLIFMNVIMIGCFLWLNHNYYKIMDRLEAINVTSKSLDEKQKRILKHFFPFYRKLSPNLQRIFEQKLLYFYYTKTYDAKNGLAVHDRMRLFVSAYAAQVSLGFKEFGFSHIYGVVMHPRKFYSENRKNIVCWDLDKEGYLHLSWTDFFEQLKKHVVLPVGLEVMAHAMKKDENEIVKEEIFRNRNVYYKINSYLKSTSGSLVLFQDEDFKTRDNFFEACIKNYFSYPVELKNKFPELFRKIDQLLYSEIRLV
ncbi:MAG: zinc-dependent peptidase [Cytophagaceae bacterium]|nr:zinc-dependent peptidase [Cytophagaceae bacterium]